MFVPVYAQTLPPSLPSLGDSSGTLASDAEIEALYNSRIGTTESTKQIINTTRQQCEADNFLGISCISMIYESPNTIIFEGDLLLLEIGSISDITSGPKYWPNPYVWRAVDQFKGQGYALLSTELEGQGSQGNPHKLYIVMSK
jgi:hypothetical protein